MRYYVTLDNIKRQPDLLFRTPDTGGPPMEVWRPTAGEWVEDVSLIDYFTGDQPGLMQLRPEQVGYVQDRLAAPS